MLIVEKCNVLKYNHFLSLYVNGFMIVQRPDDLYNITRIDENKIVFKSLVGEFH